MEAPFVSSGDIHQFETNGHLDTMLIDRFDYSVVRFGDINPTPAFPYTLILGFTDTNNSIVTEKTIDIPWSTQLIQRA